MNTTERVIREKFQQYYLDPKREFYLPPRPGEREYGFLLFKEKFMVRHRGFKEPSLLQSAIRDLVPAHVYFSTAYYQDPIASMAEKGWKGADLVFDIDADHLDTSCKPVHDSWKCKTCGATGKGGTPKVCPKCKNDRLDEQTWLCDKCLQQAKEETTRLLEMIHTDFGIDPTDLGVFFSGHRGYHVHVRSNDVVRLGEEERREIADYVLAQGLDPQLHDLWENPIGGVKIIQGPRMDEVGWRGRIVRGIYDMLGGDLSEIGLSHDQIQVLKSWDRDKLFDPEKPFWSAMKGIGLSTWKALVAKSIESARIDTVVTTDVHRLIRLPGTLNGHTGLLAMSVPEGQLDEFDPFTEPLAFQGKMKILIKESPEFKLGGQGFGPFLNDKVELPAAAAMLLLCKRRAEPLA